VAHNQRANIIAEDVVGAAAREQELETIERAVVVNGVADACTERQVRRMFNHSGYVESGLQRGTGDTLVASFAVAAVHTPTFAILGVAALLECHWVWEHSA
jgi:hypothetical protein